MAVCEFDKLFTRNVPHILERIFFSLDYVSFTACRDVCEAWSELHSSEVYRRKREELLVVVEKKAAARRLRYSRLGGPFKNFVNGVQAKV